MFSVRSSVFETNSSSTHVYIVPEIASNHSRPNIETVRRLSTFVDGEGGVAVFPIRLSTLSFGDYHAPTKDDVDEDDIENIAVRNIGFLLNYVSSKLYSAKISLPKDKIGSVSKKRILEINKHNESITRGLEYYFLITNTDRFLYIHLEDLPPGLPSLLGYYINHHIKELYGFSSAIPVVVKRKTIIPYNIEFLCKEIKPYGERYSIYYFHQYRYGERYSVYCPTDIYYDFHQYLSVSSVLKNILLGTTQMIVED